MEQGLEVGYSGQSWHARLPNDVVEALGSDVVRGLDRGVAERLLTEVGPNRLQEAERWIRTRRLGRQFRDVLIWLLLIAAFASGFLIGAWVDAIAIIAIVVLNAALGYAQETRADTALAQLKRLGAPTTTVVRSGLFAEVPADQVVPGDLLVLEIGDQIAADARVVESIHMEASEASLTGEAFPTGKSSEPVAVESVVADRMSMVFAGTTVARGRGKAIVVATGMETEIGRIAALMTQESPPTPLQVELGRIGRRLAIVAIAAGILVFGAGYAQNYPFESMALTGVALAVAAIPEGLPAVVTMTLAAGLRRMAQRHAIVRHLPAVEALGAVDVICTDKTGTLTKAQLAVTAIQVMGQAADVGDRSSPAVRRLLETGALCNDAHETEAGYTGDPLEVALLSAAAEADIDRSALESSKPRVDECAFDSGRKRMSTIHSGENELELHVKGAPEVILARSSHVMTSEGPVPLSGDLRRQLLEDAEEMASRGLRTLGLAERVLADRPDSPADAEADLTYLGLVGLSDEVREEVPAAVASAREAGVRTVMVTGDHQVTASAVADSAGLDEGRVMHGSELREMNAAELADVIKDHRAFARVDPVDKVKIVEAWRASGATVAMTGDGVNDAPALHAADIGVGMGSGTDVARQASALVLTDDNYSTIVHAIDEGRRVFHNIRNVVHYLLSANASEVMYVVVGFFFFGFLGEPLLAVQLLWINLLSDALPALALGLDVPARDLMKGRPGSGRDILSGRNLTMLVAQGAVLAAAAVTALVGGYYLLDLPFPEVRTMVFTTLVLSQLVHAINVRTDGDSKLRPPGGLLLGAILSSTVLQIAIIYSGIGNTLFRTVPLSAAAALGVLAVTVLSFVAVRLLKVFVWTRY